MCIAYDISLRKRVTASLSVLVLFALSVTIISPASAQISIPQISTVPQSVTLSVESSDMSGTTFPGQWVELWQDGMRIQEDFTPFTATVDSGVQYDVFIYDDPNEGKFFDHWEDDSTNPTRTVTMTQDTALTAFFQTDSTQTVSLLVESADMEGNAFEGMWIEMWQNGIIIQEGPTPFSTHVESGVQYEVFANNFENITFDHWDDFSTNPQRAFAINDDATFTAFYQTDSTSSNNSLIANDDSVTTDEDVPATIDVMANDNLSGLFSVNSVTEPSNGMAAINDDNTITYLPNQNFFGSDSFQYTVSDSTGLVQDSATVFVTVNPVNDAPVAVDDDIITDEDTTASFFAEQNDSDVDGDEIFVASVEQGASGSAEISSNGTVVYTPNPDFNGGDSFTYVLSDINGATDAGTVFVTINPVNDAPVAADDSATTVQDSLVVIDVLNNDSDIDGDSLNVTSTSTPANGTAAINSDDTITYLPNQGFVGDDSFTYAVSDDSVTDSATIFVKVTAPQNNPPVAADDAVGTPINQDVVIDVLSNDSDPDNDTLSIISTFAPSNGTATINANNTITYSPDHDFAGNDSFSYTISDGNGGTDSATVSVIVRILTTISVSPDSWELDVNELTNKVYLSHGSSGTVSVIDGSTDTISTTIPIDDPDTSDAVGPSSFGIGVNPDTNLVYVADSRYDRVLVIDDVTNEITNVIHDTPVGGMEVNSDTNKIYARGNDLFVIDGSTNTVVKEIPQSNGLCGAAAASLAINSVTNTIYQSCAERPFRDFQGSFSVIIINGTTDTVTGEIQLLGSGAGVPDVIVNSITNKIYATETSTSKIFVIDGNTNTVVDQIQLNPIGHLNVITLTINERTDILYAASFKEDILYEIDGQTNEIIDAIPVGDRPNSVAVNQETNRVYVANFGDNTVTILKGIE